MSENDVAPDRSFLFVLGSARAESNSEILARAAAEQLPASVRQRWLDLDDYPLPDFEDGVHESEDRKPHANEEALRQATLGATDLVLVSPLYWYTLSAQTKRYLDYWSGWLSVPDSDFHARMAGRTLWAVTAMAHRHHEVADGLSTTLNLSAAYMHMRFGGVLLGSGVKPGEVREDERATREAKTFFQREAPLARFPHK
ncbi:NAD(P)H-dependent oxidoreductase [Streptomyces sp. ODS28]|uniref:flavodoxin family protein n=1 Tax=Streptomyces sp. ODS28 TaxID=3136688 RepID=UPI0031EAE079